MAVLFLDPLALGLLVGLVMYVWLVWHGSFRRWFGRPEAWTVVAWPVPLLAIVVPVLAGALLWLLGLVGIEVGDGDVTDAVLYAAAYVLPTAGLAVWPPRWLLPGWASGRIADLPTVTGLDLPEGVMPAVQGRQGHGSRARWVWRVDGVPGHVWIDGPQLRFRAGAPSEETASPVLEFDDEEISELRFSSDGDLRLESPRGGWWSRGHLDVELAQVDRILVRAAVPWRRDGLITLEVEGRQPVQLWVADARQLRARLSPTGSETPSDPDAGPDRPA